MGNFSTVDDPERPSKRLVEQRLRNRAMEALVTLSEGDQGIRHVGVAEWVNQFFDVIDDDAPWDWRDLSVLTPEEVHALDEVHRALKEACEETPQMVRDDEFIATGWPSRIQPLARGALTVMQERGRLPEDAEEGNPSGA